MAIKSTLPERYPDIIAMYARGHANSLDILKADFVQWPPKGLDIVRAPDIDIEFKSMYKSVPGLLRFFPSFNSIFMMLMMFKSHPIATGIYVGLSTFSKVMSLRGFVRPGQDSIYLNDAYRIFAGSQRGRRLISHVLTHEYKHVVQGRDKKESLSSALDGDRLGIKEMLSDKIGKHEKYLAEECELQARLHTVMVGIYHQYEKMPTTPYELMAALHSQGINLSKSVVRALGTKPSGVRAQAFYAPDKELFERYADQTAINGLNSVFDSLREESVHDFTVRVLPFIYGDMLELYGDRLGHKRMGHTHNIQLREVFYKAAENYRVHDAELKKQPLVTSEELEEVQGYYDTALEVVKVMPKDDAVDLGCKIIRGDLYHEHGSAALVAWRKGSLGEAAVKAIFSRDDMSRRDRHELSQVAQREQTIRRMKNDLRASPLATSSDKRNGRIIRSMELVA